jgi:hypothetical protein
MAMTGGNAPEMTAIEETAIEESGTEESGTGGIGTGKGRCYKSLQANCCEVQGCQILLGKTYQYVGKYTNQMAKKLWQNFPVLHRHS